MLQRSNPARHITCYRCGLQGHYELDCRTPAKYILSPSQALRIRTEIEEYTMHARFQRRLQYHVRMIANIFDEQLCNGKSVALRPTDKLFHHDISRYLYQGRFGPIGSGRPIEK